MERGWYARGRLAPLWGAVGGRDKLAKLTGIQPGTLSGYNTGRLRLGGKNAERIAAALGVSVLELGAPLVEVDQAGRPLLDHLEELADAAAENKSVLADIVLRLDELATRLRRLEDGRVRRPTGSTPRGARP